MQYPTVSIVIPVYNNEKSLKKCLESILNLEYPKNKFEVLIIDGGSQDRSVEIAKGYNFKIFNNKYRNAAAARNIGIKKSVGEYIAFTDSDCYVDKKWISNAINLYQNLKNKDVICIGGPNLSPAKDSQFAKAIAISQNTFIGSGGSPQSAFSLRKKLVYSLPNCNAIYKREIFEKVGYYDKAFRVGQDAELNFRIRSKGYKFLYSPNVVVWHYRRSTFKKFTIRMFEYGYAMAMITKKHKSIVRWYSLVAAFFTISILLSPIMIVLNPFILNVYVLFGIIYILLLIASSLDALKNSRTLLFILVPFILINQHLLYGLGFIIGLIDFKGVIFRKNNSPIDN